MERLIVAIDGPAGSGKSTTAKMVSAELGYRHIDTGAMYRACALAVMRADLDPEDEASCVQVARNIKISFREREKGGQTVWADGVEVTAEIRTPEVTRVVSPVSAHAGVRTAMVRQQRMLAEQGGVVLEGRDIGTVVLPWADVKIYLAASSRVRAERRKKELDERGIEQTVDEVEKEIIRRDEYDSTRETSPLREAVGSVRVDTSELSVEDQVNRVVEIVRDTASRLERLKTPDKRTSRYYKFKKFYRFCYTISRAGFRVVFGLRIKKMLHVHYEENYIYACNHVSYADPPAVGSSLPQETSFIAKSALFKNPLMGRLIRALNAMPLKRGAFDREAISRYLELLNAGKSLLIFPQGTRSQDNRLQKPKRGVGYLALKSGRAVVPLYVTGSGRLLQCLFRREKLRVMQGLPIRLAPGTEETFDHNERYQQYSEMVMEAIQALKEEVEHGR